MRGVITCRTSVSPKEITLRMICFSSSSMAPDCVPASSSVRSSSSVISGAANVAVRPKGRTTRLDRPSAMSASGVKRAMHTRSGRCTRRAIRSGSRSARERGTISPRAMVQSAKNRVRNDGGDAQLVGDVVPPQPGRAVRGQRRRRRRRDGEGGQGDAHLDGRHQAGRAAQQVLHPARVAGVVPLGDQLVQAGVADRHQRHLGEREERIHQREEEDRQQRISVAGIHGVGQRGKKWTK